MSFPDPDSAPASGSRLGISGKYFCVLAATLTVLPLWGWLRRMFDDRLAIVACLIYALHGKLIAISPLILRDSTFWLLFALVLYYTWRAVGELRIGLFLAAGAVLTLAVHTRTKGWLLLIPLVGWAACRWTSAAGKRVRLASGILLCIAVIPAAVTVVNFTWLRGIRAGSSSARAISRWASSGGIRRPECTCPLRTPPA